MNLGFDFVGDRGRRKRATDVENANGSVVLVERHIEIRSGILGNEGNFAVLGDTDDLNVRPLAGHAAEVMAEWVSPRPKLLREIFVNHRD